MRTPLACALLLLGGCSDVVDGFKEGFKQGFGESFAKEYEAEFTKGCTESSVKEGAAEHTAREVCGCLARELVADNESVALVKASMSPEGPEFQGMLEKAQGKCNAAPSQ